ncbi:hypothetical protein V491_04752 [Pseudogymnoascus sp. VKM F-3775]|nr:hypothetical protein V491_04752 [Pseudogymnoascus sp. VKM F-3775]
MGCFCPSLDLRGDDTGSPLSRDSPSIQKRTAFSLQLEIDQTHAWWFSSTVIPLIAAFVGPIANVLSIAALVTYWRVNYSPAAPGNDEDSIGFPDPPWCIALKSISLACGIAGNIFLLLNFTKRIRYIVALPITIILWYFAAAILTGIIIAMNKYIPPHRPSQAYSQGFWDAIIGAVLYTIGSIILMVNILGFFLGHYPQYFNLTDEQCGMIFQTMMLCLWLSGGAGVFHKLCGWSYVNALYFCDGTILTVGFGDFTPGTKAGRGLIFPYAAGGIIILGLLVSSIQNFVKELGHDVVRGHMVRHLNDIKIPKTKQDRKDSHDVPAPDVTFGVNPITSTKNSSGAEYGRDLSMSIGGSLVRSLEQRDRFDALRAIQERTRQFTRYSALALSAIAFCIIWFIGALVFWRVEQSQQHWSYSNALYFCYISLTTIGYGDLTPTSNSGKPFFIIWSLVAVPTMTILISNMGDTIIASYKRGTLIFAAWTILKEPRRRRRLLDRESCVILGASGKSAHRAQKPETKCTGARPRMDEIGPATLQSSVTGGFDKHNLAVRLAKAIQKTSLDLKAVPPKRYNFDEWIEYSTLLRFTFNSEEEFQREGVLEWVKLAECKESEWLLGRLTESLIRYLKTQRSDILNETRSKGLRDPIPGELNFENSHYV